MTPVWGTPSVMFSLVPQFYCGSVFLLMMLYFLFHRQSDALWVEGSLQLLICYNFFMLCPMQGLTQDSCWMSLLILLSCRAILLLHLLAAGLFFIFHFYVSHTLPVRYGWYGRSVSGPGLH